ncbi:MAG: DUF615 domain-containing protein [Alcanivorax sp.]|nr:DUF615 domain-containing protein [Alcanivorax sp.]
MTEYNEPLPPSKTQLKQEMSELQQTGLDIMALKPAQQARLPLNDPLRRALEEARRITNADAQRRHALFVGRLIRDAETDAILSALAALKDPVRQQRLLQWTEQVVAAASAKEAEPVIQQILEFYPRADRQALRNQARNLIKARLDDPGAAEQEQRERFKRERKRFLNALNDLEKNAPLY